MALNLPEARYPGAEARISFYDRLKTHLEALPGVEAVAFADFPPGARPQPLPYELAGAPQINEDRRPTVLESQISPAYFGTLGATVLSGRDFNDADGISGVPVAIVSQRFASQYWPRQNPLGKRLRLFRGRAPGAWLTVVGVVSDIVQDYTRREFDPLVYLPYRQKPTAGMWALAQTRVPPRSLATAFRREVQAMDSDLPVF